MRVKRRHVEKYLGALRVVDRMQAELCIAAAEGRIEQDALDLLADRYGQRARMLG